MQPPGAHHYERRRARTSDWREVLTAYGLGQLSEEELAGIDGHLATCAVCRQVVEGVAPDTLLTLLRSAATEPDSTEWLTRGESGGDVAELAESGSTAPASRCAVGTHESPTLSGRRAARRRRDGCGL